MIVIGLGYGDEGKGLTTSYLCSHSPNPMVVRFNGGHQAGHTVVHEGTRHVFSSFGAGTLQGVPTYLSHHCTFYPTAALNELHVLIEKGVKPELFLNPLCPVTTPYDLAHNQKLEDDRGDERHGSVGVGFGSTIQRQEDYCKLFVQDLKYPKVVESKLANISKYYGFELDCSEFMKDVEEMMYVIKIMDYKDLRDTDYSLVFEGAQGILLDQDYGFFPNVTRSNTTSRNAIELYKYLVGATPDIYYITRTYLTRHGAGYMPNETKLPLINNENETNVSHDYQGDFRTGVLDVDLLNYALDCDNNFSKGANKHLVVTCMDQLKLDVDALLGKLNTKFDTVLISSSDISSKLELYQDILV